MTVSQLPNGRQQFSNADGLLVNGTVYTYVPGTTTFATTYSDSAGTVPNTNPIVLDGLGSASIWGSGAYRQVVYDNLGNLVWDQVVISPLGLIGAASFSNIAALRAQSTLLAGAIAYVIGWTTAEDGGEGWFYNAGTGGPSDNSGTYIRDAMSSTWKRAYSGPLDVKWFGAVGNGSTNDTSALQAALAAAQTTPFQELYLSGGSGAGGIYKITAPLAVTATTFAMSGDGPGVSTLKASGNFAAVLTLALTTTRSDVHGLTIDQTGTTTQCVNVALNNTGGTLPLAFTDCEFIGDGNSTSMSLVYQGGMVGKYSNCQFTPNYASLVALQIDGFNANSSVTNCVLTGTGLGINLTKTGSATIGPQGVRIEGCTCANFSGAYCVQVGGAATNTFIGNCTFDQAAGSATTGALTLNGSAVATTVVGGYLGTSGTSTYSALVIDPSVIDLQLIGVQLYSPGPNVLVEGSAGSRATNLTFDGCFFSGSTATTLQVDSAAGCSFTACRDTGTPSNGSLTTFGTNASKGQYKFANNSWAPAVPTTLDTGSSYRSAGTDSGGTLFHNKGAATPGSSVTAIPITHGLSMTPTNIKYSLGANSGATWLSAIGATTFTVNWATSGTPQVQWDAEVWS